MSGKLPTPQRSSEQFLLVVMLITFGALVTLWLTGEVGGYLASGHWPAMSLSEMGGVLIGFFGHPSDPAHAWPAAVRGQLPSPVMFYAVLMVLLLLATTAWLYLGMVLRWLRRRTGAVAPARQVSPAGQTLPSGWARPQLFRDLFVRAPEAGRVTLGRTNGRLVAAGASQPVVVLGPASSHKTSGMVVPAILEWSGPVLAAGMNPDFIRHTMSQRWQRGEVHLFDPAGVTGLDSSNWSPLGRCGAWEGAYRMARSLVDTSRRGSQPSPDGDFLHNAAVALLAALLLAAATSDRSMGDVARWVQRQEHAEVAAALSMAGEPAARDALQLVSGLTSGHRGQVYAAVLAVIAAYADPALKQTVLAAQFSADRLLDGHANTAYVCAPAHEQRRLGPVFTALVQEVVDLAYERSREQGKPLDPPLLLLLDDAATAVALPGLDALAATAASHGVQLLTTFRHVSQIQARYGDRAETILSSHRAKVILSGVTDQPTLTVLSHLLEDETIRSLATPATLAKAGKDDQDAALRARYPSPAETLHRIWP
ncbi:MAG TPA: type IV secretory system conjugative DNA transfer family protein, partial [Actinomycetota bacterium]